MKDFPSKHLAGVYRIYHKQTNKTYVGSSVRLGYRLIQHFGDLQSNRHRNLHLQSAWNKYGPAAFDYEVLEYTECLLEREDYYINIFDSYNTGYNQGPTGEISLSNTKLTPDVVKTIKEFLIKHKNLQLAAGTFRLPYSTIANISAGVHWVWVAPELNEYLYVSFCRGNRKLTEEIVIKIKTELAAGEKHVDIANRYGTSKTNVCQIARLVSWVHVASHLNDKLRRYKPQTPKGLSTKDV